MRPSVKNFSFTSALFTLFQSTRLIFCDKSTTSFNTRPGLPNQLEALLSAILKKGLLLAIITYLKCLLDFSLELRQGMCYGIDTFIHRFLKDLFRQIKTRRLRSHFARSIIDT